MLSSKSEINSLAEADWVAFVNLFFERCCRLDFASGGGPTSWREPPSDLTPNQAWASPHTPGWRAYACASGRSPFVSTTPPWPAQKEVFGALTNLNDLKRLLTGLPEPDRREIMAAIKSTLPKHEVEERLFASSDQLLEALSRAPSLTIRMIRGIIAEAAFATDVLPNLKARWSERKLQGDLPYDFLLVPKTEEQSELDAFDLRKVRIQVKMQRSENGVPKRLNSLPKNSAFFLDPVYVVEVQRTRTGTKNGVRTRPYRFGEFDVLAVSLGPMTKRWSDFVYTPENWLLPDQRDHNVIKTMQPIALSDRDVWTPDLEECIGWKTEGKSRPR